LKQRTKQKCSQLGIGRKIQKPTVFEEQKTCSTFGTVTENDKRVLPTLFSRLTPTQIDRIDESY